MKSEPVDEVESVSVFGASVMEGTWADGDTEVHIYAMCPVDPVDAALWDELPGDASAV